MKRLKKRIQQYTAVFEQDDQDRGYTVTIPALPGCISEGNTFEEAVSNIQEAAELYMEVLKESPKKSLLQKETRVIIAPVDVTI